MNTEEQELVDITVCDKHFEFYIHRKNELLSNMIRENGIYSRNDLIIFSTFLNSGDIFIDIGANIGWHSVFGSLLVGETGRVIAFEPDSKNFKTLEANKRLNALSQLTIENIAISNFIGESELACAKNNCGDNILNTKVLRDVYDYNIQSTNCVTLDKYIIDNITSNKIKLIKMDIQGSEAFALEGMKTFLSQHKPIIVLEFSPIHLKMCGASPFDILAFIDRNDYIPFQIREELDILKQDILVNATVMNLVEMTEYLLTTPGWGIDILLIQKQHIPTIQHLINRRKK